MIVKLYRKMLNLTPIKINDVIALKKKNQKRTKKNYSKGN